MKNQSNQQAKPGPKFDGDKPMYDIVMWKEVEEMVKVLTFGCKKYESFSWQRVPNMRNRYFSALIRHVIAWKNGELNDPETDLHHLAHAMCNCMFLMWSDKHKDELWEQQSSTTQEK